MANMLSKDDVVSIIVEKTNMSREEIEQEIEKTMKNMDFMINEEGAAFIVANNLGVVVNPKKAVEALKINQLIPGQSNVTVIGRLDRIFPVKEFQKKDNTKGFVRNLVILDKFGEARVSLWDSKTAIIEEKGLKRGQVVRISGATTKLGYQDKIELTLGSHGTITIEQNADESDLPELKVSPVSNISEITESASDISIEGKIVEKQEIYEFDKGDKKGAVCGITVADNSGEIRVVFWNEQTELLANFNLNDSVKITGLRASKNKYDNLELVFGIYSTIKPSENQTKFAKIETKSPSTGFMSLSDITPEIRSVDVIVKIQEIGDIKEFSKQDGQGKVANITVFDDTQSMRVVIWNEQTDLLETLESGSIITIKNARPSVSNYNGELELSLNSYSSVETMSDIPEEINFEKQDILFSSVDAPKSGVNMKVLISNIFEPREINRQDGTTSIVQNIAVMDAEGTSGRIAAWDENVDQLVGLKKGDNVDLRNVRVKPGKEEYGPEIVIGKNSTVNALEELLISANHLATSQNYDKTTISKIIEQNLTSGKVELSGTIVKAFKPSFYEGCSQCGRKVTKEEELSTEGICENHGTVTIEDKIVLSVVFDDQEQNMVITFFNKQVEKLLGMSAKEAKMMIKRLSDDMAPISSSNIVLKELTIRGDITMDRENQVKISVQSFFNPNDNEEIDQLLNELS